MRHHTRPHKWQPEFLHSTLPSLHVDTLASFSPLNHCPRLATSVGDLSVGPRGIPPLWPLEAGC